MRFADDPRFLQERRVLSSGRSKKDGIWRYTVVTPDRDVQDSRLGMPKISEVIEWPEDREKLPTGVRKRSCYLFEHSTEGEIEDAELKDLLQKFKGRRHDGTAWLAQSRGGSLDPPGAAPVAKARGSRDDSAEGRREKKRTAVKGRSRDSSQEEQPEDVVLPVQ